METYAKDTAVRKKRQTINGEMLRRIRKHMDKNNSAKTISEDEDLALATVYNVMKKISEGLMDDSIKKGRKVQDFSIAKNKISQILLKDAPFTQMEMSEELKQFGISKSSSTVCRLLKKWIILGNALF